MIDDINENLKYLFIKKHYYRNAKQKVYCMYIMYPESTKDNYEPMKDNTMEK